MPKGLEAGGSDPAALETDWLMGGSGGDGGFGWWWQLVDGGVDGRGPTRSTLREVGGLHN